MKKILSLAVLLMTALVGFTACNNDDNENDEPNLAMVETSWDFGDRNAEVDWFGDPWITRMSRHFSFYDDHTGMLISEGENLWPTHPEWNEKFTTMIQFTYTFDGKSGAITFGKSTIISDNPDYCWTSKNVDKDPIYTFTLNPDGKSIHLVSKDGEEGDCPKLAKFVKKEWVEFPPSNWGGKIDSRPELIKVIVKVNENDDDDDDDK